MTHEDYLQHCNKLFELIPEARAMAMDKDNKLFWYESAPETFGHSWHGLCKGFLGNINYSGDWKDSLVVRKWVPKLGEMYFYTKLYDPECFDFCFWGNDGMDLHRLKHNLVFKTKEEAIARSKELLGIKEDIV